MKAPLPTDNEADRLVALQPLLAAGALDEEQLARYTRIARSLGGAPVAAVSLVDAERQYFRGCAGEWVRETPRRVSFCGHAIHERDHLYVPDALRDERFADNPIVTGEPRVRFYAGFPLVLHGLALGALCLIDFHPRVLASDQIARLRDVADCVQRELRLQALLLAHR